MIFAAVIAVCVMMFTFLPRLERANVASAAREPAPVKQAAPIKQAAPGSLAASATRAAPARGKAAKAQPTVSPPAPTATADKPPDEKQPSPVPATPTAAQAAADAEIPALTNPPTTNKGSAAIPLTADGAVPKDFIQSVTNGQAGTVTGLFAPGEYAIPVVQQPGGNPDYISDRNGTVTQYQRPSQYGVTALLAHNTLSGQLFFHLKASQELDLVYGDGRVARFSITSVQSYQALTPDSTSSDFIDLNGPNQSQLTHTQLFDRVYTTTGQLVLQTCIAANGNPTWGRLFVIATPLT